jgi:hypothetical protein
VTPVTAPSPARSVSNILKYSLPSENDTFPPDSCPLWNTSTEAMGIHVLQAGVKKLFDFYVVHRSFRLPIRPAVDTMLES